MAPLPGTYWTMPTMEAPIEEVIALMDKALDSNKKATTANMLGCRPGTVPHVSSSVTVCSECSIGKRWKHKFIYIYIHM